MRLFTLGAKRNFRAVSAFTVALIFFAPFARSQGVSAAANGAQAQLLDLSAIKHVVFIVRENRSFDNLFGTFPGANGATQGTLSTGQVVPLKPAPDAYAHDICHGWGCFIQAIDNGKMDGFDLLEIGSPCNLNGDYECYTQQHQSDLPNYWNYATNFVLADNFFTSSKASTTPNHLYTVGAQGAGVVTNAPAGCDSPSNIVLAVIDNKGNFSAQFPCIDMPTLMDELESAGVTWQYYADTKIPFNSMELISHLRFGPLWSKNLSDKAFISDVQNGRLPQVSWLMATGEATDHPPYSLCFGENYTVNAVNAIMNSQYWTVEPTAIFIVWDDPGGLYDHVAPPVVDQFGLSMRSPMLVISPYAKQGSITSVQYEHSSVLQFIEDLFSLPHLTNRDDPSLTNHIAADPAIFDFNQAPRGPLPLTPRQCSPASTTNLTFYQTQPVGMPSPASTVVMRNFSPTTKLNFSSINLSGSSDFTQTNNCSNGVRPLTGSIPGNCTLNVTFTPSGPGPRTATLTMTDNDPTSPQVIAITGVGTNVTLNPALLNFGIQAVFMSGAAQAAVLTNSGTSTVTISSIAAGGDYSQTNNCGSSLAPGGSCTISAVFTPTVTGTRFGSVTVTDSDGGSPHTLALTGVGTQVSLNPTSLTFGNQAVGTVSSSQPVTLTNFGSSPLPISSIVVTGNNGDQPDTDTLNFRQTNNCGSSLAPGANCTINVSFSPIVMGALLGDLKVFECPPSNGLCSVADSPQTISLSGTSTASLNNPVPFLAQPLFPDSAAPGSASLQVTVNGTSFGVTSAVKWNGSPLTTTFVNGHQLTATIPASNLATAGTGNITVVGPLPGGGISHVGFFHVANASSGVSLTKTDLAAGNGPKGVVAGDFDNDGNRDFVVLNNTDSTATVFKGNGNGTFTVLPPVCTGGVTNSACNVAGPVAGATGDFNRDGKLDLVIANYFGNNLSILLGNGDGTFTQSATYPAMWPTDVEAADFNRDGNLDLVTTYSVVPAIGILLGNGDGTFLATSTPPVTGIGPLAIAIGDFDRDNKVDIAVANSVDNNVSILLGRGDGTFVNATKPNTGNKPVAIAAGDFTGDNIIDLATVNQADNTISILRGIGDGTFVAISATPATGTIPAAIMLGDFNADQKLDLTVVNSGSNSVSILLGNGNGTFQNRQDTPVGTNPTAVATGDFNKDGTLDLVVANQTANSASVLLGSGGSGGGPAVSLNPTSLSFGTIAIGATSARQTVTLTNTGTATLTITSITVSAGYIRANHCGGTVPPNASCTVDVSFRPTTKGLRPGTLSFNDNAPGSPQTVSLTGTGTAAGLVPTSLNFGPQKVGTTSAAQTIKLTNVAASGNLLISSITLTGTNAGDFARTHDCPASLAPSQSCTISVTFKPTAVGSRSASVSVTDNGGGSPQTVPLSGTGTP